MSGEATYRGGCLCGGLRWRALGEPLHAGLCYCADCRKASGSAFIPFLAFPAAALAFTGESRQYRSPSLRGNDAVRNFCPICGGLVFGGEIGKDESHTIYAGSLDDPARFRPTLAIFDRDRPVWVPVPEGLAVFDTLPD
jgi:hypothetical protein